MGTPLTGVIGFSGAATIRQSQDLADRLKQALERYDRVEIDCSGLTDVDLVFVQLLLAARKSADTLGKELILNADAAEPLVSVLDALGVRDGAQQRFWRQGSAS